MGVLLFQSTLSMRRATIRHRHSSSVKRHVISIHALHEESDPSVLRVSTDAYISIHALHEESDLHWR